MSKVGVWYMSAAARRAVTGGGHVDGARAGREVCERERHGNEGAQE